MFSKTQQDAKYGHLLSIVDCQPTSFSSFKTKLPSFGPKHVPNVCIKRRLTEVKSELSTKIQDMVLTMQYQNSMTKNIQFSVSFVNI